MTSLPTQRTFFSVKKDTLTDMRIKIGFGRVIWFACSITKWALGTK